MLFNSLSFAIFMPIVFFTYWAIPHKYRWGLLLIASYYFYMSWNVKYVVLILFTTIVSYFAALEIEKTNDKKKQKVILTITLISCLGVLFVFKYFNFFFESVNNILKLFTIQLHPITLKLILPVGISFYTFQTLSYVIDVYRGGVQAEKNFGIYATFISFFPQLVAGPIERTSNLLPQIKEEHIFNYDQATYGLKIMAWGFFKKMVVADNLAIYVDKVFDDIYSYQGFALVLATFFFTIQIYCDFSGYSDIARGCGKLLGIELIENFKSPYFSSSIKEFWSRWHISLSTWFRDYVYIPLGGNRTTKLKGYINLLITFLVSGLWHGANWTFVIWGAIHGIGQILEKIFIPKKELKQGSIQWFIRVGITFTFVALAWVFFRAQTLNEAIYVFKNYFVGVSSIRQYIKLGFNNIGLNRYDLFEKTIFAFIPLSVVDFISLFNNNSKQLRVQLKDWIANSIVVISIFVLSYKGFAPVFVYFQF